MEDVKKALEALFDEMLDSVTLFKKKTYASVFETKYQQHREIFVKIGEMCRAAKEEDKENLIRELAGIIPEHAYQRMQKFLKKDREKYSLNYNMAMVVYVVPMFTYNRDPDCERIADQMVKIWNERKVTTLVMGKASYEEIARGFKGKFCYITTAVCERKKKPDDCYELTMLRSYRDHYLMKSLEGRRLVGEYYEIAPQLVMAIGMQRDAEKIYDRIYEEYLMPCVQLAEMRANEACKNLYMNMVRDLQNTYGLKEETYEQLQD